MALAHVRAVSPYAFASLLAVAGTAHFTATGRFAQIMPSAIPQAWHEPLVQASGLVELGCAALVAIPRTRRIGGIASAALLVAVFPANVQMALDGGLAGAGFPLESPVVAWLRLPLQVPLFAWAVSIARSGARDAPTV